MKYADHDLSPKDTVKVEHVDEANEATLRTDRGYHLFCHIHRCEDLKGQGRKKPNPYVSVAFDGYEIKTHVVKHSSIATFDTPVRLPVRMPLFVDTVVVTIFDKQRGDDAVLARVKISLSRLRLRALKPKWFNFYGFDVGEVNQFGNIHSLLTGHVGIEENFYLGRLLLSGRVQQLLPDEVLFKPAVARGAIFEEPSASLCHFFLDVLQVRRVSGKGVFVQLCVGSEDKRTKVCDFLDGFLTFNFHDGGGSCPVASVMMNNDRDEQVDAILNLWADLQDASLSGVAGWQRVGYKRFKFSEIARWRGMTAPTWISMKPMPHHPRSVDAGQVLCHLKWSPELIESRGCPRYRHVDFELRVYCFRARNLISRSTPRAYLKVKCGGSSLRTAIQEPSDSPIFNEVLLLHVKMMVSTATCRLQPDAIEVEVFDDIDASEKSKSVDVAETEMIAKRRILEASCELPIGRAFICHNRVLTPENWHCHGDPMRKKWVKLSGGDFGDEHVGDILVGFQLLKRKHASKIPVVPVHSPGRVCMVSLCVIGLRNVLRDTQSTGNTSELVSEPTIQVVIPEPSKRARKPLVENIRWSQRPDVRINNLDVNKAWTTLGPNGPVNSYDFLTTLHLNATFPSEAVFDPRIIFRLLREDGKCVGEGSYPVLEKLPWLKKSQARKDTQALEKYELDADEVDPDDEDLLHEGYPVSDSDDDVAAYFEVDLPNEPTKICFNADDSKSFPAPVTFIHDTSPVKEAGVQVGDIFVGYKQPDKDKEQMAYYFSPKQAQAFCDDMDKRRMRPLKLRFRRRMEGEVMVVIKEGPLPVSITNDHSLRPPEIRMQQGQNPFQAAGVQDKWRIIDINGVNVEAMHNASPHFQSLYEQRPILLFCRSYSKKGEVSVHTESSMQAASPVRLSGITNLYLNAHKKKLCQPDDFLKYSRAGKATINLPPSDNADLLNCRIARNALIDVRGLLMPEDHQGDDAYNRAHVNGKLEDYIGPTDYDRLEIKQGNTRVATLKLYVCVVSPPITNWWLKPKVAGKLEGELYDPIKLRKRYTLSIPRRIRVRVYIIRGINLSSQGNPYPYIMYGEEATFLKGKAVRNTSDPKYFHIDERDVRMPEDANMEIGFYHSLPEGSDVLLGKSTLDLEDRWNTPQFQRYMRANKVPVEDRTVYYGGEGAACARGTLEIWIEMLDANHAASFTINPLVEPPPVDLELRLIMMKANHVTDRFTLDKYGPNKHTIDVLARCELLSRSYRGQQPQRQDSDIHRGCVKECEWNWRCVWSKVKVVPGSVNQFCKLQLSLWEISLDEKPILLGQADVDVSPYCQSVATSGSRIEQEVEVPLTNVKLNSLDDTDLDPFDGAMVDPSEGVRDGIKLVDVPLDKPRKETKAAAWMKVKLQVFNQSEASTPYTRAGLGRSEPNQQPTLLCPKTGRAGGKPNIALGNGEEKIIRQDVSITESRTRLIIDALLCSLLMIFVILHSIPVSAEGCTVFQNHCSLYCPACNQCTENNKNTTVAAFLKDAYGSQSIYQRGSCVHKIYASSSCTQTPLCMLLGYTSCDEPAKSCG